MRQPNICWIAALFLYLQMPMAIDVIPSLFSIEKNNETHPQSVIDLRRQLPERCAQEHPDTISTESGPLDGELEYAVSALARISPVWRLDAHSLAGASVGKLAEGFGRQHFAAEKAVLTQACPCGSERLLSRFAPVQPLRSTR
ncbi:hypothetical protein CAL65_13450 [Alkalilimnicola ehrlichii]|uniref:Uncharacterized protein n=1 Tax=Alkalilimnicola ehrlichii TaxID=351052 RepID=A0A3E0WQ63_9GAMM|nr:hypothetical protein CAL65_13450 [Alkalilimnicola ehrlichii]